MEIRLNKGEYGKIDRAILLFRQCALEPGDGKLPMKPLDFHRRNASYLDLNMRPKQMADSMVQEFPKSGELSPGSTIRIEWRARTTLLHTALRRTVILLRRAAQG
jgi:hypothetical protein